MEMPSTDLDITFTANTNVDGRSLVVFPPSIMKKPPVPSANV